MGRRAESQSNAEADQDQRISSVEDQQAAAQQMPPTQAQGGPGPSVSDQIGQLSTLHQQGALSDDEFAAAKAKILGS